MPSRARRSAMETVRDVIDEPDELDELDELDDVSDRALGVPTAPSTGTSLAGLPRSNVRFARAISLPSQSGAGFPLASLVGRVLSPDCVALPGIWGRWTASERGDIGRSMARRSMARRSMARRSIARRSLPGSSMVRRRVRCRRVPRRSGRGGAPIGSFGLSARRVDPSCWAFRCCEGQLGGFGSGTSARSGWSR